MSAHFILDLATTFCTIQPKDVGELLSCDTSYSKSVLLLTTVLRKEIYESSVSQSYTEFWPNAPKAAQAYSSLQALFSLI